MMRQAGGFWGWWEDQAIPILTESEAAERVDLLRRLDGLVRSREVKQMADARGLGKLRAFVVGLEKTQALVEKYGRLQAEAAPDGW